MLARSESPHGVCQHSDLMIGDCIARNGCRIHSNLTMTHAVEPEPDDRCADCGERPGDQPMPWWQLGNEIIAPRVCPVCADERRGGPAQPSALSNEAYHRLPSLSASGAKILLQDGGPAKYRWEMDHRDERPPKDAYDEGHAIHHFVFGLDPAPTAVKADSWRTNAAKDQRDYIRARGGVPLLQKDYNRCQDIAAEVVKNTDAASLLFAPDGTRRGVAEEPIFWTDPDTKIPLRARPDWHSDDWSIVIDLKSTADASADGFARSVYKFGYDVQSELYRAGVRELHGVDAAFVFLCVETSPPYLSQCHMLDDTYATIGRERFRRAVELWRDCTAAETWPGYPTGWDKPRLSPPKYVTYLEEDLQ